MRVAIIGGGYAGMAAAVTLVEAGLQATVYEAANELGGRARRVNINGVALDNGCHILLGAYSETLRLLARVHPSPADMLTRVPLDWNIHKRFRLKAARLPAPLHLAVGLLSASGALWRERLAATRFMHRMRRQSFILERDVTVDELLTKHRQGDAMLRYLWEPLCIAALNTPPKRASAQVFLNVLRDGMSSTRAAGDLLFARQDLSALFPDAAAVYVRARGGALKTGQLVTSITSDEGGTLSAVTRTSQTSYDHVICAVSPHRAAALLSDIPEMAETRSMLDTFTYQPIYSVYLQFDGAIDLPTPMLGLTGMAQWVFDRGALCGQRGLLAAVISAEGPHQTATQDQLAQQVLRELEAEIGLLPPLLWHRVIAEKRATFECVVGLRRPTNDTPLGNLHLAGDYTAGNYPATIEGAVRSGLAAAKQVQDRQL